MVRLLVTYMEQRSSPHGPALLSPRLDAKIKSERPLIADYRRLYREIGEPVQWDDRLRMSLEALENFLKDAATRIFVLYVGDIRVGLCEAYLDTKGGAEITNFGIVPRAQGQKLGPYLLDHALRVLWSQPLHRIWLHTDTNDHPNAVRTYKQAGFQPYFRQWQEFPD